MTSLSINLNIYGTLMYDLYNCSFSYTKIYQPRPAKMSVPVTYKNILFAIAVTELHLISGRKFN